MVPTDGLVRGMEAVDTGEPIKMPVGEATLGRVLNVIGKPVDKLGPVEAKEYWPIHRDPPSFEVFPLSSCGFCCAFCCALEGEGTWRR